MLGVAILKKNLQFSIDQIEFNGASLGILHNTLSDIKISRPTK